MQKYLDRLTKKKWNIFVVHNTHTDLGYTHRQEWVYRAHWRFIENVIDILDKNEDFRWTCETYWTVENFMERTTEEYKTKFAKYVSEGKIEISTSYLNTSQLMDSDIVYKKAMEAKAADPATTVAVFQDVNAVSRDYAKSLAKAGTKYLMGSIHTHHGFFAGSGKQRPFVWDLGEGQKILVLNTEHYQLGNEIFPHAGPQHKYTFKDDIEAETSSLEVRGVIRLVRYLELLESEGYEFDSLLIPVSGKVTDNSPANGRIVDVIKRFDEIMPDNISIKLSRTRDFFEAIEAEGKPIHQESGEWPDWWTDGVLSTPEAVRLYREAQRIYHLLMEWNKDEQVLDPSKLSKLEKHLGMFAEHTWGHFTSTGDPYSNENNLLLARKKAMASNASEIAWTLMDEIKERSGESFIHLHQTDKFVVYNPYDVELDLVTSLEIDWSQSIKFVKDRFLDIVDNFKLVDEEGNEYPATVTIATGGMENLNSTGSAVILTKMKLKPKQKITLEAVELNENDSAFTSSTRKAGVENEEDLIDGVEGIARYNRNGIESKFYKIEWSNESGIHTIIDKETGENIVDSVLLQPVYDVSPTSSRRKMGRNRKGPSYKQFTGKLIDHNVVINKANMQVVELIFEMESCAVFKQIIRLSNFAKEINIGLKFQKQITSDSENLYAKLPFNNGRKLRVLTEASSFYPWEDQVTNSVTDYVTQTRGFLFEGKTTVAVSAPDNPVIQLGSLDFQRREVMRKGLETSDQNPHMWLMTNYWETNFAGTLEGNYLFNFTISSGKDAKSMEEWVNNKNKSLLTWPVYLNDF